MVGIFDSDVGPTFTIHILQGFDAVNWESSWNNNSVTFSYHSKNGEEGNKNSIIELL